MLKKENIDLSKIIKYITTSDYIIGVNTSTKNLVSIGTQEINLLDYLEHFKIFSTNLKGSELIEQERYANILNLFDIELDRKYIILELHSNANHEPIVYIFNNVKEYIDVFETLSCLYLNINGLDFKEN